MWGMWRVLVLEDDLLEGDHVCDLLVGEGMDPLGPVATTEAAVGLLDTTTVDAAILNIRLQNGLCFEFARGLVQRQIPFLFLADSVGEVVPAQFQAIPLLLKPFKAERLLELLRDLLPGQNRDAITPLASPANPAFPSQPRGAPTPGHIPLGVACLRPSSVHWPCDGHVGPTPVASQPPSERPTARPYAAPRPNVERSARD